jgi:hypothetical protein
MQPKNSVCLYSGNNFVILIIHRCYSGYKTYPDSDRSRILAYVIARRKHTIPERILCSSKYTKDIKFFCKKTSLNFYVSGANDQQQLFLYYIHGKSKWIQVHSSLHKFNMYRELYYTINHSRCACIN